MGKFNVNNVSRFYKRAGGRSNKNIRRCTLWETQGPTRGFESLESVATTVIDCYSDPLGWVMHYVKHAHKLIKDNTQKAKENTNASGVRVTCADVTSLKCTKKTCYRTYLIYANVHA